MDGWQDGRLPQLRASPVAHIYVDAVIIPICGVILGAIFSWNAIHMFIGELDRQDREFP